MFVCFCISDALQGCVWDAAQVSVDVCRTTSLQGTGYQAEREAIMLITLHTPWQSSVQRNCALTHKSTPRHTVECAWRQAHAQTHTTSSVFLFILSFLCLPTLHVWRPWTSIPFCFQERLFYILINSTPPSEINWHSFNDFKFLWGCSFVSGCQRAASEIGLNVLSSHTPG